VITRLCCLRRVSLARLLIMGVAMPLVEALVALAVLAGNTVVTSAVTDAWEAARQGFSRLLGRGDPDKTRLVEQRLADTHDQLIQAQGADLERVQAALEAQWVTRITDLIEEDPGVEADLRTLVEQVRAQLPATRVFAADHSVAAGGNVTATADGAGVAANVIHGDVHAGPTKPGPVSS
jgi:hypothetical protein